MTTTGTRRSSGAALERVTRSLPDRADADRAALERWEDEGGRPRPPEPPRPTWRREPA